MYVTINPIYSLRIENNCAYIIYAGNGANIEGNNMDQIYIIPPFLGFILSHFKGNDLQEALQTISKEYHISKDKIYSFVKKCFQNEKPFVSNYQGIYATIPPMFLIESNKMSKVRISEDANYSDKFENKRLDMPAYMNLMITSKCKTNCIYCYADRSKKDDMDIADIIRLIDQAHNYGIVRINISGGDIFAFDDWKIVLQKLHKYQYCPFISTKIALKEDDIAFLHSLNINRFQFSLDSVDSDIETTLIKISGDKYLSDVEKTISLCDKYGIYLDIKSVITKYNDSVSTIKRMYHFLSKFNCIKSWNLMPAFSSPYKENFEIIKPDSNKFQDIFDYLSEEKPKFQIFMGKLDPKWKNSITYADTDSFLKYNKTCTATKDSIHILSNGMVAFCEMLYYNDLYYLGDTKKQTLKEIWNSPKAINIFNSMNPEYKNYDSKCYKCESLKKCKLGAERSVCIADILKSYGNDKWDYPDPRCPKAPKIDLETLM